jgi:hypothetical protein
MECARPGPSNVTHQCEAQSALVLAPVIGFFFGKRGSRQRSFRIFVVNDVGEVLAAFFENAFHMRRYPFLAPIF